MKNLIHDRLSVFLNGLDRLDPEELTDAFANEAMETGGSFLAPGHQASHMFEITLHGIFATGATEAEAIHNWTGMARRHLAQIIEDDGFITVHPPIGDLCPDAAAAKP